MYCASVSAGALTTSALSGGAGNVSALEAAGGAAASVRRGACCGGGCTTGRGSAVRASAPGISSGSYSPPTTSG